MGDAKPIIKQSPPVDTSRPYDASTLAGKTILITGGANGLGAHMVRAWASHGAHVVIGDIDDKAGEAFVAELRAAHPLQTFHYQRCNVVSWDDQTALFDAAVRLSPGKAIDVVVPNAGVILPGESMKFENPRLVDGKLPPPSTALLDINITGAMYTTHLAIYHLTRNPDRDSRCILVLGSIAGLAPFAGQCHYTMSKHAVAGMFRALRGTAFPHGIRVNMLAPYYVGQSRMLLPVAEAAFLAGTAGPALIPDVIDAATRLIADQSIAGRCLVVGPRLKGTVEGEMPVGDDEGDGQGRAIWECYAHDYDQVDPFTLRYLKVINAVSAARGMFGWLGDIWGMATRSKVK